MIFTVTAVESGFRLDQFLVRYLKLSRTAVQKKILCGEVFQNNRNDVAPKTLVHEDDKIEVVDKDPFHVSPSSTSPGIFILAETETYVVVEKPSGIVVHPSQPEETGTLIQYILLQFPEISHVGDDPRRPGIVQRLDKEVSGVMVIARTQAMFEHLKNQFLHHAVKKEYIALVYGRILKPEGMITFPVARSTRGHRMASRSTTQEGKPAKTEYCVEQYYGKTAGEHHGFSLLSITLHTGRTHQIRAHMLALDHPIVGDRLYHRRQQTKKKESLSRVFLHAAKLSFFDLSGKRVEFESPLPEELKRHLEQIS